MPSPDSVRLLRALSRLLGWIYTISWSLSFYPQAFLNFRRRSTNGLTPAFPVLNLLGFACYASSTLAFFLSSRVQEQYRERHNGENNTVRGNDVAFATHALVMTVINLSQFWHRLWGFERRKLRVGKGVWAIVGGCCLGVLWITGMVYFAGDPRWQWIDVVYALGYVKLFVTIVKYMPQAWANYLRKSTVGWSIDQILMDLVGGALSIAQLVIDSSLQKDWSGLIGNPVKLGLGNISILFDLIFIAQHYIFYRGADRIVEDGSETEQDGLLARQDEEAAHHR